MESAEKTIYAPAKINLFLLVKGRRPDGYHELESFMQKLDLADEIMVKVSEGQGVSLSCPDSDLPVDEGNLAWRAARAFLEEASLECRVQMILKKTIPVAAGLGGGSSDAAAVLLALNDLLATRMSEERLASLALSLGADVPFFVKDSPAAVARGVGERLDPVPSLTKCTILLVNPGVAVSTSWVFDNFALTSKGNLYILAPEKDYQSTIYTGTLIESLEEAGPDVLFNDLESVTVARYPEIGAIKKRMLEGGAAASLMTGSGPTVFGIFTDEVAAVASYEYFRQRYGKKVFLTVPSQS
jgi:4-diphosphocytidyl-2-C-methyl-D-erythritol kinase